MDKSESYLATPKHRECYEGLIKSYDLDNNIFSTYGKVYSLKRSRKDKDKDEEPSAGSDRGLKKRKTSKDAEPIKEEPEFMVVDWDIPQDQEENLGQNQSWLMTLASSAEKPSKTFNELMSTPIDFSAFIMNDLKINNLTQETLLGPAFRLLKGTHSNYAELEYDFEEWYKAFSEKNLVGKIQKAYLQGGISTMTYTTSLMKTKAAQYDLPGIEDMVPNIWVPVKVAYDKHTLWGISHWREQHKSFYGKHGYGYMKEIVVRRADNDLYKFKEYDFLRLRINDIDDMLLLVVQNRLTNLSGDDVSDFAIALRMFTRSLVIQKRVEDLQLRVKSYQKMINVPKPQITKSGIRKRDPYTP
ncbi:hypothetical protein Tco_0555779 [Tanacetum coccineum]